MKNDARAEAAPPAERGRSARPPGRGSAPALAACAALVLIAGPGGLHAQSEVPDGYELVYAQDFEDDAALDDFSFSDENAWRRGQAGSRGYLDLAQSGKYRPQHRSPRNIAVIDDLLVADFVLEADVWQTGHEYGHRDLSFFFGFEGPNRYGYAHLASEPSERSHNVFLVDHADRAPMAPVPARGVDWGAGWKKIRIERRGSSIRVHLGRENEPTVSTDRDPLGWGRVGFGSFDDTGRFSRIRIWAPETRPAPDFSW